MLVLRRKPNEKVVVAVGGFEIVVEVVDVKGKLARIGFTAPPEAVIHRLEVWDRIRNGEQVSSSPAAGGAAETPDADHAPRFIPSGAGV
jgi:carbon storage regulator CsrA